MDGRKLATIFEGEKNPGVYNFTFRAHRLPAGLYICRMNINNKVLQQKLIIER